MNPSVSLFPGSIQSAADLAYAFGWPREEVTCRTVTHGNTILDVARGAVAGQPAALFAKPLKVNGADPGDSAALYSYHSATPWAALADEQGLTVFNSHWLSGDNWFRLPRVSWSEPSLSELHSALSPTGVVKGEIGRLAARVHPPSAFLKPVDDELVERLDRWRDEALKFTGDPHNIDNKLQKFFAQLFVLRTVEDRQLQPKVPRLDTILRKTGRASADRGDEFRLPATDTINRSAWRRLFQLAQRLIGSELFAEDVTATIPPHVIAGVVRDLYMPHQLPGSRVRYDFSWIEADVLGLAYEKYLSTVLHPIEPPAQAEMFLKAERDVERIAVRKHAGVFYTPKFLSTYLTAKCVKRYFEQARDREPPRIIDFACGSGSFLVSAVNETLKYLKARDPNRNWARKLVEQGHIVGIDVDENAVMLARMNLWQRLVEEPDALPLPNLSQAIIAADGLDRNTWGKHNLKYDIILGNPPFQITSRIPRREKLEATFDTAKGRYDFSYLFVEQALRILSDGGCMGMVVPNRLYRNRNGAIVRGLLQQCTSILSIVDFGSTRPFPDASAYIGAIVAEQRDASKAPPRTTRVIEVKELPGEGEFMASILLDADAATQEDDVIKSYLARHPSGTESWSLLSDQELSALVRFKEDAVPLGEVAGIYQGIRTAANDLFVFVIESTDEMSLCRATNGAGESVVLERDLLEPVVYGADIQRYCRLRPARRLLYPYRGNKILSEPELQERYPFCWQYLIRNRDILASRVSMIESGRRWYELVRPRDETWLRQPKLLIRDLAPRTAFALDELGSVFLVGGTAVIPEQSEMLLPLLAYLNSNVINSIISRTTPQFRGSFQKIEPQHLVGVPVMRRLIEDEDFSRRLADLADRVLSQDQDTPVLDGEAEIDRLIAIAIAESGIVPN